MTLEQVEVILGGPARDESTGPLVAEQWEDDPTQRDVHRFVGYVPVRVVPGRGTGTADAMPICWASDSLVLWIVFDGDGRVLYHYSQVVFRDAKNPLAMLRRWLGL